MAVFTQSLHSRALLLHPVHASVTRLPYNEERVSMLLLQALQPPHDEPHKKMQTLVGCLRCRRGSGVWGRQWNQKHQFQWEKVTEMPKNDIIKGKEIDVWIDDLTPCLRDKETGTILETEYHRVSSKKEIKEQETYFEKTYKDYAYRIGKPRKFNWGDEWDRRESNSEFYKLSLKGEKEIQGLAHIKIHQGVVEGLLMESLAQNIGQQGKYGGVGGHLTAIGVKRSYETGGEGFMYFLAKSELVEHYKKELKATVIPHKGPGVKMGIFDKAAEYLYTKYFGGVK